MRVKVQDYLNRRPRLRRLPMFRVQVPANKQLLVDPPLSGPQGSFAVINGYDYPVVIDVFRYVSPKNPPTEV